MGQSERHIFDLGQVSIRALVECSEAEFCSLKQTNSQTGKVGIKSKEFIDPTPLKIGNSFRL